MKRGAENTGRSLGNAIGRSTGENHLFELIGEVVSNIYLSLPILEVVGKDDEDHKDPARPISAIDFWEH